MPKGPQRKSDISYRITRALGRSRNEIKTSVLAHHPEHGVVGLLNLTNEQWATNPRQAPPEQSKSGGKGLNVSLAHVSPQFQKQGIGSAMYNIAHREMGYAPGHDVVRTKEGERFAQSVSGGERPGHIPKATKMQSWELPDPGTLAERQSGNWMRGEKVDPTWARASTPTKPKRRRGKQPEQLKLPGTEHL
jgi:hypothetical protein